jgi:hypothetical protein
MYEKLCYFCGFIQLSYVGLKINVYEAMYYLFNSNFYYDCSIL